MIRLDRLRIAVAGAGAFGLCTAVAAAQAGATIEVFDPAPLGVNASGVAAGMIAPLGEALFDPAAAAHWEWLRDARDLWRGFAARIPDLKIHQDEALYQFANGAAYEAAARRIEGWGVPMAADGAKGFRTSEDWLLDPKAALLSLATALEASGGRLHRKTLGVRDIPRFDVVVFAGGIESRGFVALAPELAQLQPVKGHILSFRGAGAQQRIVRTPELYLVAQEGRLLAGATMQLGRDDRVIEPDQVRGLHQKALELRPDLEAVPFDCFAGVRAATPDGLPMVGRSSTGEMMLATGARRNGWLLAPLVAEILLSYLSGADAGRRGAMMDPARFVTGPPQ